MFVSCYKPKVMQNMSFDDLLYVVGVIINKNIIKPPRCKIDGEFVYIDEYSNYYQCDYCSRFGRLYVGDSLDNFDNWKEFNYDSVFK